MALAASFHARFPSLERVRGRTQILPSNRGDGKRDAKSWLEHNPPTVKEWEDHLAGELGLGLCPIRDDNTCRWGVIDVDRYDVNLAELAKAAFNLKLPLVACRSKSGGAHLFLFTSEPVPAKLLRGKLMDWAVALGHGGVEIFPKQVSLASVRDNGSWLNMPYYDSENTQRYAVHPETGERLNAEEFLQLAENFEVTKAQLTDIQVKLGKDLDELFLDAPPCLQALARRGFPTGTRNMGLFNLAVYLRKRWGDEAWGGKLDALNDRFMSPPLGHKEVASVEKSVGKKAYEYKCREEPILSCCNRQICLTRKFGVSDVGDDKPNCTFGNLERHDYDPPIWIWDIDGLRIELETIELEQQRLVRRKIMERHGKLMNLLRPRAWENILADALRTLQIVKPPEDALPAGQLWGHLKNFCLRRDHGLNPEHLLNGHPYSESGQTWFRSEDLMRHLQREGLKVTPGYVHSQLRNLGLNHRAFKTKGTSINAWGVAQFSEPEALTVPNMDPPAQSEF